MKQGIHPKYVECTVICGCGNTFETRATVKELRILVVEIGTQRTLKDTAPIPVRLLS